MADPYTPFGFAFPGFNPRLPGYQTPNTMTGQEMGPPPAVAQPSWGDRAQSFGLGLLNPFGFTPPPPVQQSGTVPTLTGDLLPLPQRGADWRPRDPEGAMVGSAFGMSPAFRVAGKVAASEPVQAAGRTLARPLVGAPAATAGATYATTGQTAEGGAAAMGQIDADTKRIRDRQATQQKELERLQAEAERFRNLKSSDKNAVMDAQRYLQSEKLYDGRIDGSWGDRTTGAVQRLLERNREQQAAATSQIERIGTELQPLEARRSTLTQQQAEEEAERNTPEWRKLVRDYSGLAGMALGPLAPGAWRYASRRSAEAAERTAATQADALIRPTGTIPERVAGTNQFFRQGGAEEPFQLAPNAPLGFAPTPAQQSAAGLYPPGNTWMRPADWARTGTFAASGAASEAGKSYAQGQLDEARADFKKSPTPANASRVARWESIHAGAAAFARASESAALTYPGIAGVQRYRPTRPNTAAAGAEVMELNALLRNRPIDPLEVRARQRDRGFSIPNTAPLAEGELERRVSPAGNKILIRHPDGVWRDESGKPGTPKQNWRRISAIETDQSVG
jgi:hypothetical protein